MLDAQREMLEHVVAMRQTVGPLERRARRTDKLMMIAFPLAVVMLGLTVLDDGALWLRALYFALALLLAFLFGGLFGVVRERRRQWAALDAVGEAAGLELALHKDDGP